MKKILILLLVIICQLSVNGQQSTSNGQDCETLLSKKYLKSYWNSGLTVLSQPLHYDWKDWTAFGGVAAATTLAFVYDDEIYGLIDRTFDDNVGRLTAFTDVLPVQNVLSPLQSR